MKFLHIFTIGNCIFFNLVVAETTGLCRDTLQDEKLKQISWSYLKQCLTMVSDEQLPSNTSENIWRLMKLAFDSIDNIPPAGYKYMGYALISISLDDLRNISMESVDVVEIFGSIRSATANSRDQHDGFSAEQLTVIAQKVRMEWLGKNPETYSEYDLRSMGEIVCYLDVTDIENIHADAFKEAAEWIGLIEKCPEDRLQALANLAKRKEAFGEPSQWSKLEVSIIGNILNGLAANEINAIDKDKLQLNHFYKLKSSSQKSLKPNSNVTVSDESAISKNYTSNDGTANKTQH